jgi:hypothetical protein
VPDPPDGALGVACQVADGRVRLAEGYSQLGHEFSLSRRAGRQPGAPGAGGGEALRRELNRLRDRVITARDGPP